MDGAPCLVELISLKRMPEDDKSQERKINSYLRGKLESLSRRSVVSRRRCCGYRFCVGDHSNQDAKRSDKATRA
jgi:hypothetical protein